jgi:hypothetical protein
LCTRPICYSVALADIDSFQFKSGAALLRKKLQSVLMPYLNHLRFPLLAPFLFSGNSGTSVIFSAPEGLPDSLSVFL